MFVYNNCSADARVHKEATTLGTDGYDVTVVAVLDRSTEPYEDRGAYRIIRIDRDPLHYRLRRRLLGVRRRLRRVARRAKMIARTGLVRTRLVRASAITAPAQTEQRPPGARLTPAGAYRALRWRILRRVPVLRRAYYRARTRRMQMGRISIVLGVPLAIAGVLAAAFRLIDRAVSRIAHRLLMFFHRPLMFFDYYRRAYRLVRRAGADALHAHDLITLPVAAALGRRLRKPLVYDSHELYTEIHTLSRLERRIWRTLERWLIPRADVTVTVCESIASELEQRYRIARPRILLNAPVAGDLAEAPVDGSRLRALAGVSNGGPIVLYQGGFSTGRGLPELVSAARMLTRGTLVMMGWGTLEDPLRARVDALGLGERVKILPPVPRGEVLAYAAGADIGVIPYQPIGLNNRYTTPNKLFDYIAVGLAVAGSRLPELERFIEGRGLGITFDPYDPGDIAAALNFALEDRRRLEGMRAASREAARELTWEEQQKVLIALYAGALAGGPLGAGDARALVGAGALRA